MKSKKGVTRFDFFMAMTLIVIVFIPLILLKEQNARKNEEIAKILKKEIGCGYKIIEIDGCEYVVKGLDSDSAVLAHKGNCKFCEERRQMKAEKGL